MRIIASFGHAIDAVRFFAKDSIVTKEQIAQALE
jgi:hypothetical protein